MILTLIPKSRNRLSNMSARCPVITDPSVITMHGNPESVLAIMWERGYKTSFAVAPEINSRTISVRVGATRAEIKACHWEDALRLRTESERRPPDWWRKWHGMNAANPPRDWESEGWRITRIYFDHATMAEVCNQADLKWQMVRPIPEARFAIFKVWADRHSYRGAQLEWLRRMMANPPKPL